MLSAAHGQPQPAAGDAGSSVTALQDEVAALRSSLQRAEQELAALRSTVRELAVDAGMLGVTGMSRALLTSFVIY